MGAAEEAERAFAAYEAVRHRLPRARFAGTSREVSDLTDLADDYDAFILDAFGVLNVGERAIAGAPEHVRALQRLGRRVLVLSNAASVPKRRLVEKYARLGFDFAPEDVVSSREVMLAALDPAALGRVGVMGSEGETGEDFGGLDFVLLGDDPAAYDAADSFALLGSADWTPTRQGLLEAALRRRPRPLHVGNPDIVAPRESGLSREPGHYAHALAEATGVAPIFYGKPFANAFEMALARLGPGAERNRVVMVGDTLHTDVLGARAAGLASALITGHGALAPIDARAAIARSGIVPDVIMPDP